MPCSSSTSWTSATVSDLDLSPMAASVDAAAVNDADGAGDSSPIHSSSSTASPGGVLMMKGKRTKRRRMLNLRELSPTPPPPATPPPALPSAAAAAGKEEVNKDESMGNASPASSSSACQVITLRVGVDEEEEDLALCLMLLAQGRTDPSGGGGGVSQLVAPTGDEQSLLAEMQVLAAASTEPVVKKRRRRPSVLLASTSAGAAGGTGVHDGVYECKTCNKRFSSFQALGGHRTSHTKPGKAGAFSGSNPSAAAAAALGEEAAIGAKPNIGTAAEPAAVHDNVSTSSSSPSQLLQLIPGRGVSTPMVGTRAPRPQRAHECSICHAEFSSGQALGGHMRRHRPLAATSATPAESTTSASTGIEEIIDTGGHQEADDEDTTKKNSNNTAVSASTPGGASSTFISLDLNLPAPMESDDHSHRMKALDALPVVLSPASTASASGRFPLVAGTPPVSVFGPRSSSSSAGLVDCLPLLS